MPNLYLCNTGDKKAKDMIDKFPDSITMSFYGYSRQGCGEEDHACGGGGHVNIYTSIYNYLTVISNSRFSGISTGYVNPNTMLTANFSNNSKIDNGEFDNSDASLTIRLERR